LLANSIVYWADLEKQFHKYFFAGMHEMKLIDLTSLRQRSDESVAAFMRFKEVRNKCYSLTLNGAQLAELAFQGLLPHIKEKYASKELEEVVAGRGSAVASEQCCSGWLSSASGAGRTAPESEVEASAAAGRYPGYSAPAGQNRCRCSWCSPSICSRTKFIRDRYCTTSEKKTLIG
jgi:hypothetical protein